MESILLHLIIIICVSVFLGFSCAKELPSFIGRCHYNDPHMQSCILKNVENLRSRLAKGIPTLFIPALDPLEISEITIKNGDHFQIKFTNIKAYYANEFVINNVIFDVEKLFVAVNITFPKLRILSDYNVKGNILSMALDSAGPADGNYTNVKGAITLKATVYEKNKKHYAKWVKQSMDLDVGRPHFLFENIFKDNKELNERTNEIFNENVDQFISEIKPMVSDIISNFISNIINRLCGKYALEELFIYNN